MMLEAEGFKTNTPAGLVSGMDLPPGQGAAIFSVQILTAEER